MIRPQTSFTPALDSENEAIGGHYVFTQEARITVGQADVLYLVGYAVVDRSCCGIGGCAYALVPGTVLDWHYRLDPSGQPVSRLRPISDRAVQRAVTQMIRRRTAVTQVNFL